MSQYYISGCCCLSRYNISVEHIPNAFVCNQGTTYEQKERGKEKGAWRPWGHLVGSFVCGDGVMEVEQLSIYQHRQQ